ncbi:hypothetical protein NGA35_03965 [Pseudomonas stutzeri]|nr:hypothetical protein [Stutzerimonas stutzeri]
MMNKPLRIVIVTYNWPPRNAIGTHRPYSWAKYWSTIGAEVTVLTAQKHEFDAPLDLNLSAIPNVKVIEVAYGSLGGKGLSILVHPGIRSAARWLKDRLKTSTGVTIEPRRKWIAAARQTATELAKSCDVVVSTFGPPYAHLIAKEMKIANPAMKWVADYRDLWSQDKLGAVDPAHVQEEEHLELESVGRFADAITTVSDELARSLKELLKKDVSVITNGFDITEELLRNNIEQHARNPVRPLRIVHTGTLFRVRRDPTPLLSAIRQLQEDGAIAPGDISVDFYGERAELAGELSKSPEYSSFIRMMGHVDRERALQAQREAGLLLLAEGSAPEAKGILTGKVFEYISSGTPILSIGSGPDSAIYKLLNDTSTGFCAGTDTKKIKSVLLAALNGEKLEWYAPDTRTIMNFSRKSQAELMLNQCIFRTTSA